MKKLLLASTAAAALLATISTANAGTYNGNAWPKWYIGLSGSVGFLQDADVDGPVAGDAEFDTGYGAGAQLGYLPGWYGTRLEAEIYYRRNGADSLSLGGLSAGADGHVSSVAYMANAYYDFQNNSGWTPYVGGGIGWASVNADISNGLGSIDDNDNGFAWQLMAGISWEPTTMPMTVWSLGYRYFTVTNTNFDTAGGSADVDYDTHNIEANVRFRF